MMWSQGEVDQWSNRSKKPRREAIGKILEEDLSEERKSKEKPQKREPNSKDWKEENNEGALRQRSINKVIGEIVSTMYNINVFYYMSLLKSRRLRYIIQPWIVYGNNAIMKISHPLHREL